MTWAELKQRVEELGVKDGDEICLIDVAGFYGLHSVTVERTERGINIEQ